MSQIFYIPPFETLLVEYRAAGGKQIELGKELEPGPRCSTWIT